MKDKITDYPANSELTKAEYEEMRKTLLEESIAQADAIAKEDYDALIGLGLPEQTASRLSGYRKETK
jgi:hypothetical protein